MSSMPLPVIEVTAEATAAPPPSTTTSSPPSSSSTATAPEDKIQVAVRIRELLSRELKDQQGSQGGQVHWEYKDNRIWSKGSDPSDKSWSYDRVFPPSADNEDVHCGLVAPVIDSVLQGFNATVLAYGQTASGKTHTMLGNDNDAGVIYRAIDQLFSRIDDVNPEETRFHIRVSYIEIYNENLSDLLLLPEESIKKLDIREDKDGTVNIVNIKEELVRNREDIFDLMSQGEENRRYGDTNMNEKSSRSHTIFRLIIESSAIEALEPEDSMDETQGVKGKAIKVSQLNLVDLAGSERVAQTGATGKRLDESKDINKSLMNLSLVIEKLSEKLSEGNKDHIPYRNSKLTRILKNSLGGNARTVMICCVSPAEDGQTKSTLDFASRVKKIVQHAQKNEFLDDRAHLVRMQKEMMALHQKLQQEQSEKQTEREIREELEQQLSKLRNQLVSPSSSSRKRPRPPTADAAKIQRLEARVEELEKKVKLASSAVLGVYNILE